MEAVRVLVVEDEPELRKLLTLTFETAGMSVAVARDGQEAVELIGRARPNIVVSDLAMPRMDGLDLVLHLRASREHAHLPVVLLTALPHHARAVLIEELPEAHIVSKPPRFAELVALVRELGGGGAGQGRGT